MVSWSDMVSNTSTLPPYIRSWSLLWSAAILPLWANLIDIRGLGALTASGARRWKLFDSIHTNHRRLHLQSVHAFPRCSIIMAEYVPLVS